MDDKIVICLSPGVWQRRCNLYTTEPNEGKKMSRCLICGYQTDHHLDTSLGKLHVCQACVLRQTDVDRPSRGLDSAAKPRLEPDAATNLHVPCNKILA